MVQFNYILPSISLFVNANLLRCLMSDYTGHPSYIKLSHWGFGVLSMTIQDRGIARSSNQFDLHRICIDMRGNAKS